jgi:hypothetical protein
MRFHGHHWHGGPAGGLSGMGTPLPSEASGNLRFLDGTEMNLRRQGSRLQIRRDWNEDWTDVSVVRLFPLSEPWRWVSVLDSVGREVGVVRDLAELPRDVRRALRDELNRRYLVPQILKVTAATDKYDLVEWVMETDRGPITFMTRNLREQAQRPLPEHLTMMDVDGNRYDIPDMGDLDPDSLRLLETRL